MNTRYGIALLTALMSSPSAAELLQLDARGTAFLSDFSIVFDDSGDGLLQIEEIVSFTGVTGLTPADPPNQVAYDGVAYVPEIPGIATAGGTINPDFPCEACWEFTPSNLDSVSDGWFASRWTYRIQPAPDMRVEFVGNIDRIQVFDGEGLSFPASIWGLTVGDPLNGEVTYDSTAPVLGSTEDSASYRPNSTYRLDSTAISIVGSGTDTIFSVSNDSFSSSVSAFVDDLLFSHRDVGFSGPIQVPEEFSLTSAGFQFRTQDLDLLSDTSLPRLEPGEVLTLTDPDPDDLFQVAYFVRFDFRSAANEVVTVVGVLTPVTISSAESSVTVPADDCTVSAGGCNPTGGHEIILPDGFVPPPGATITQTPVSFVDPRVDANGRCDGQTPLELFDGDLVLPPHICGSPQFEVLVTEANFDILTGTIINTMFPEVFVDNPLDCNRPIIGDPQLQDIVVWQPTVRSDVVENRAIELTYDCGSSRGRTRGFSFYVVGTHIDFGIDFNDDPQAVVDSFASLVSDKLAALSVALRNAEPSIAKSDFPRLLAILNAATKLHDRGNYHSALRLIENFLSLLRRTQFDVSSGFNHEGNLTSRADNIRFTLQEKILPFD